MRLLGREHQARQLISAQLPTGGRLFDIRAHRVVAHRTRTHITFALLTSDATSLKLLVAEWTASYMDTEMALPALNLSFRDYVVGLASASIGPAFAQNRKLIMSGRLPLVLRTSITDEYAPLRHSGRADQMGAARPKVLRIVQLGV